MIRWSATLYVATAPVDLRASFDRLAGIVREQVGREPCGGALFAFHNRRRTLLKLLWRDGTGWHVWQSGSTAGPAASRWRSRWVRRTSRSARASSPCSSRGE
jgi:transposase